MERRPSIPHVKYEGEKKIYKLKYKDGKVRFYKGGKSMPWIPGINMATLESMCVAYPDNAWWYCAAGESVKNLPSGIVGDLRSHNLIVSRGSFNWIDLDHHKHRATIMEDITKVGR